MKYAIVVAAIAVSVGAISVESAHAQMGQMQGAETGKAMRGGGASSGMQMMGQGKMGSMMQQMHGGFGFYLNLEGPLGLTKVQIKKLREMKYSFGMEAIQRKAGIMAAKLQLEKLQSGSESNEKEIETAIRDVHAREAEQEIALHRAKAKARGLLTAEQMGKLKDLACPMCGMMHEGGMMQGMKGMMSGSKTQMEEGEAAGSSHEQHH